jgi:hypothetical protein
MACEITVGKIKPRNVHTRANHLLQNFRGIGGRSDGTDNFGFIGREGHGFVSANAFSKLQVYLG